MISSTISERTGIPRSDIQQVSRRMFEMIGDALQERETVKLANFATLALRSRAERTGRNPRTGESYPIAARHIVSLVAGADLTEKLTKAKSQEAQRD
ncbi:HU family DNA-binding protein [Devosia sp. LjRoot3]|uniref:HU family DNA-binding protein n=1 Tax=Devosia sp. LjRoot3 TaxID=3342319 RepID=UPI003F4FAD2D